MHFKSDRFNFVVDDETGMFIGPDDCHYKTKAEAIYYGRMGLCGCGSPSEISKFLIDCLVFNENNIIDLEKLKLKVKENPDLVAEFILHFLNSVDILEHGGSVYGSWITDFGKQVIEIGPVEEN